MPLALCLAHARSRAVSLPCSLCSSSPLLVCSASRVNIILVQRHAPTGQQPRRGHRFLINSLSHSRALLSLFRSLSGRARARSLSQRRALTSRPPPLTWPRRGLVTGSPSQADQMPRQQRGCNSPWGEPSYPAPPGPPALPGPRSRTALSTFCLSRTVACPPGHRQCR